MPVKHIKRVFALLALTTLLTTLIATAAPNPVFVDGTLTVGEWSEAEKHEFAWGTIYSRANKGTLYLGVDVVSDNHDDGIWSDAPPFHGDALWLIFDSNVNGRVDVQDVAYGVRRNPATVWRYTCHVCRAQDRVELPTAAKLVGGFANSLGSPHPHRTWEASIPVAEVSPKQANRVQMWIVVRSDIPSIDHEWYPREPDNANSAQKLFVSLKENTTGDPLTRQGASVENVKARVISVGADGIVEIRYPDGSRRILNRVLEFTLGPGENPPRVVAAEAPLPELPYIPGSPLVTWLDRHNQELLETIRKLLVNEGNLKPYLQTEQGLSTYRQIERRTRLIDFIARSP